jgi:oxygen-independent coproporphyrinogen-3 oxidase
MYAAASIILEKKGYCQYEISSFAKPGFACKHNCKYWRRENTLGFGLGAHSFWKETRWHNSYDLDGYTRDPCRREDVSRVMPDEAMEETMFLGLRMNEGVGLKEFERQFGATLPSIYGAALRKLTGQGLLQMDSERIRLTAKGRDVANRVFVEFIQ